MSDINIETIDRPYDSYLFRSDQPTSNGSVETQPVKSEGGMNDVWINTYLRSTNWLPKTRGFYIDGQTGYAEFANVYVSGEISATRGIIGGFTITTTDLQATSGGNTIILSSVSGLTLGPTGSPLFTVNQSGIMSAASASFSGSISGSDITGGTITGSVIKTSLGSDRVEIDLNGFRYYYNNVLRTSTGLNGLQFYDNSGILSGTISGLASGDISIAPTGTETQFFGKINAGGNIYPAVDNAGSLGEDNGIDPVICGTIAHWKYGFINNLYGFNDAGDNKWYLKESATFPTYWEFAIPIIKTATIRCLSPVDDLVVFVNPVRIGTKSADPVGASDRGTIYYNTTSAKLRIFTPSGWVDVGGVTGANTSLSNLTSTSINQNLLPAAAYNIGSSFLPWGTVYANTITAGYYGYISSSAVYSSSYMLSSGSITTYGGYYVSSSQVISSSSRLTCSTPQSAGAPHNIGGMEIYKSSGGATHVDSDGAYKISFDNAVIYGCPLPFTPKALNVLKKTKHKKLAKGKGHYGDEIEYLDIADAPAEMKMMGTKRRNVGGKVDEEGKLIYEEVEEEDIEYGKSIGFLYSCIKHMHQEIEDLKAQLAKKP